MLASTCGRMTSIRPYRMSLNNCCQLLQDRRAGQALLGGYRHGQPMAVLLLDQPQFVQGGQAGQGLACVFRPLGGKHRLQIARRPARPGCACTASRCRHGRAAARRRGRVPVCRRCGTPRTRRPARWADCPARGADGPQMGRDHRPAAPVKDRNFQRGFHRCAHRVGKKPTVLCRRSRQTGVSLPWRSRTRVWRPSAPIGQIPSIIASQTSSTGMGFFPAKGRQTGEFLHVGQRQLRELHRGVQFQFRRTGARRMLGRPGVDGLAESG